jgi:hypothetical protein
MLAKKLIKTQKTSGGGLINKTLNPYGYSAKRKLDGDHVVEMQLGGPNEL